MKTTSKRLLFWTPRVLCLLFAAFISLFALDVINETHGFWQTAVALTKHLMPTFFILAVLALSWRWEWVGGLLFVALGIFYIVSFRGRFPWSVYAVIAGPLFAMGLLFLLNWRYRAELHAKP